MGFENEVEQSIGRPCRQTSGGSKATYELTSSIVPRGTSFHRWVELECSPIVIDPARLSCRCDLPGPAPGLVSPGSSSVKRQAEQEGLDRLFRNAGLEWAESGCSMCVGINGDLVASGERCASTTNRNFRGRQGVGARTHIMSPAMVAAAAVSGHLADMRPLMVRKN